MQLCIVLLTDVSFLLIYTILFSALVWDNCGNSFGRFFFFLNNFVLFFQWWFGCHAK